ncbi:MAG: hypothetical protein C0599_02555 [Salinivirgaceae bacterium]|nr:MAG: hypothetical protein C0599_02555 [Salinivirgaceae bacterium]
MNYIEKRLDYFVNKKDKLNPDMERKGRFFVASMLLLVVMAIPYTLYALFESGLSEENFSLVVVLSVVFGIVLLYRKFPIRVPLVNFITVIMMSMLYTTFFNGGLFSSDNIWCIVYSCWVFLVANKKSGIFWFGFTIVYYVVVFYAEQIGLRDFKADFFNIKSELVFVNYFFSGMFLGLIIYLHEKGKDKYLNALLLAKKDIEVKNKELEVQKQNIVSSITYAKRIQEAVFPQIEKIENYFKDSFVLFKPRDIVSGYFYWIEKIENKIFYIVADCTGHGVPGAFMSLLGISFLNEIVPKNSDASAGVILDQLRDKIKKTLKQKGEKNEAKDGMDLVLCVIDTEMKDLHYAGANNPIYIVRSGNEMLETSEPEMIRKMEENNAVLFEIKPNRQPIAIYHKEKPFTTHKVKLLENDVIYMFSDGYADQFGGDDQRKFMSKNMKSLMLEVYSQDFSSQKQIFDQKIEDWKNGTEQVDDILLGGIKI